MDLRDWARLVRIPNVFTVLADVTAAFLLVAHSLEAWPRWICVLAAGVCLYWAGMIFNDVFDVEVDRRERPSRPLPSGAISIAAARRAGGALLVLGVALAALGGYVPVEGFAPTWRPAVVALLLVIAILLYDGPLKKTPVAPVVMGLCRMLSFLLGGSAVLVGEMPEAVFQPHVWAAAAGFGIYVMGVTLMGRREASDSSRWTLGGGVLVLVMGIAVLAFAPRLAGPEAEFRFRDDNRFALLIGMLGFLVALRGVRAWLDPSPERVQMAVKGALLSMIPLAAAFALLGAGTVYALGIFALVIPAIVLSARFRMT